MTSPELASVERYRCAVALETPISAETSADDMGRPDVRSASSTRSFVGEVTAVGDWTGAMRGRELVGIDAALHQSTGAMGGLFEHAAQLVVGGVEHLCEGIKTRCEPKRPIFDLL